MMHINGMMMRAREKVVQAESGFSSFGKDLARPMGVKLSGPIAGVVCIIGIVLFMLYPEKRIMHALEENRSTLRD